VQRGELIIYRDFEHPDEKQVEELNRKYSDLDFEKEWEKDRERRNFYLKILAFVVVLLFLFSTMARHLQVLALPSLDFLQESQELADEPRIQELREAVVTLQIGASAEVEFLPSRRRGTGFNISEDGLIVTNRHLVENAASIGVSFFQGPSVRGENWLTSNEADLALIEIEGENLSHVETEKNKMPAPEERVMVIGNPLGYNWVISEGIVGDYRRSGGITVMEVKAPIHPGSSGSPVFNANDEVVGVIFAVAQDNDEAGDSTENKTRGLAVPLSHLEDLLEEFGVNGD